MSESSFREFFRKAEEGIVYNVEGSILDFTEDLCRVMAEKDVSRAELARRIGTSPAYVTKILRGTSNFTLSSMVRVAMALGCDLRIHLAPRGSLTRWYDDMNPYALRSVAASTSRTTPSEQPAGALVEVA
jgi:transcriptional regulator with XRE-family HTH domain